MDHTHIVQASDLDRYAPTRDSQKIIPELIYWLVKSSSLNFVTCRIPYGDSINQPGWDGVVETEEGFLEYVPKGKSYWEIGTKADPQEQATENFTKRTKDIDDTERANSSFVFVTPRSSASGGWNETEQAKWLKRRRNKGWKFIRVIDGVKLADWLREYPALGRWMSTKLNLASKLGCITTPTEHWEDLVSERATDDPALPSQLFTIARNGACDALQALFEGKTQTLMLFAESPQDVADFVSAFLAGLSPDLCRTYSSRCLYINDEQAWRSIVESRSPHILVADPRLVLESDEGAALQTLARRRQHSMIIPLCGGWSGSSPEIIKLRSPSQAQIETVLRDAKYPERRAKELARIGGDRISALRRHLRGYGTLPPYATWENATLIAQAGLVGKWDGNNSADRAAIENLLGKSYGEWIEILRPNVLRSDSPLVQRDEKWRFVARGEAWNFLGSRITDDDLRKFGECAVAVLGELNPRFDLPKEDRFEASIHGKVLKHSELIRGGIAETLALIGSHSKALSSCSIGKAETTALLVVRELLEKAEWRRWTSLDMLMPLLAEAAPDEFLDSVESALADLKTTPFRRIFAEEGGTSLGGRNYMCGLLWALETLAWDPRYISRVSVALADLASIDPGGTWANRPASSLADIFLPWHVQTVASFEKRKSAIEAVLREHNEVGWTLLLSLLPHNHGFTTGCRRPLWREMIPPDWKEEILMSEYWKQVGVLTELAVKLAENDPEKLTELIKRLPDLPKSAHDHLLEHLTANETTSLPEAARLKIWESLEDLIRHHRKFFDAKWALPVQAVNNIASAAQALAPSSPEFKYHHLFSGRDFDLYNERANYEEQRESLNNARQVAIAEILSKGGLGGVFRFAASVTAPNEVGQALGRISCPEFEAAIIPSQLISDDETTTQLVAGFVWARFWTLKIDWVDSTIKMSWPPVQRAKLLTLLPFAEEVWTIVSKYLAHDQEGIYWKNAKVNPYGLDRDLTVAVEKLLEYGREGAAVVCISRIAAHNPSFDESLATRALLAVLDSKDGIRELDNYQTVELIRRLQTSPSSDQEALFRIEWNFLAWLDRFSTGSPVTLEKRLAADPAFFAEVVGLVFRRKGSVKTDEAEVDEGKQYLARNAYKLLTEWGRCPGSQEDGLFDADAFNAWIDEARRLTKNSGHAEVAQIQIGHVLTHAPADPSGLWIHKAVAATLNLRDTSEMRSGFTTQIFNNRGVHGFTHGQEERELANANLVKAEALDTEGYTRFATAMRALADGYERDAKRESERDPFGD